MSFNKIQWNSCNPNCKGPRKLFELHDFRIIGVFYKSLLSKGPTDPLDLNDFLNYRCADYMGSTVYCNNGVDVSSTIVFFSL